MPITIDHRVDCLEINERGIYEKQDAQDSKIADIDKVLTLVTKTLELRHYCLNCGWNYVVSYYIRR